MIATITSNQDIHLSNISPWEEELVDAHFSAEQPNASRYVDSTAWDGVYRRFNRRGKRLARPFLAKLRAFCKKSELPLITKDSRPKSKTTVIDKDLITPDFLAGVTLKDYQVDGVKKICISEVGVFSVTTGGGKTEMICAIVKAIHCHTVIIAEQTIVIDQIIQRLSLRHVCDEPGVFYAGKRPDGEVVIVGTIQSLVIPKKKPEKPEKGNYKKPASYKRAVKNYDIKIKAFHTRKSNAKILHELIKKCDMIIVDECDLAVGDTYKKLFRYWYKGRRRYGFTGTPYDEEKPVQNLILQEHLGSVIYSQDRHDVQDAGLIIPLKYYMIAVGEDGRKNDARAYDIAVDEEIVYSENLHNIIASICAKFPDDGTLILVERDDLGHALNDLIPNSQFYHGKTPKNQRREILKAFEDREKNVLIGGKNVRRGLDLKGGCENLIIATGGKLVSEFDQRLGRARRLNSRGEARVFDLYFLNNKYLYAHSRRRLRAVVEMGYDAYVVYRDGILDGEALIRSRFHRPKRLERTRLPI